MNISKVNFLVIGAQKSGTSALDLYLRQHPQINMARRKECHFFNRDQYFVNDVDYSKYHHLFDDFNGNSIKGECTPAYIYWRQAIERIYSYNKQIKLIAILRNPIDRAYSAWNMETYRGNETLSFSEAIRVENQRNRSKLPLQHRRFSYIDRGYYSEQIRRIWRHFPHEQILFIKYEDLFNHLNQTALNITNFLKIDPFNKLYFKYVNSTKYKDRINEKDWLYLKNLFYFEIKQLESMLNWNCKDWFVPQHSF